MPAVMSKAEEERDAKEQERDAKEQEMITLLTRAGAANIFAWLMMIAARPEMMLRVTKGDAGRSAEILATLTTSASFMEFMITPFIGKLSDRYGRRPFMVYAPLVCSCSRLITFACSDGSLPMVVGANFLDRCISGSLFPLFLTVMRASIQDFIQGERFSKVMAANMAVFGLSTAIAPATGAFILSRTKDPKWVAFAAAAVSFSTFAVLHRTAKETLTVEKQRPVEIDKCNPFSFTKFWTTPGDVGKHLRSLSLALVLIGITADMHDTRMVLMRTKLGFGPREIGFYMLGDGATLLLGSKVTLRSLSTFGPVRHVRIAAVALIASFFGWSQARRPLHVPLTQIVQAFGNNTIVPINTMVTMLAISQGMGNGEIQANLKNQTTLMKIFGPIMFATAFARFGQRAPFFIAAFFAAAGGLAFSSDGGIKAAAASKAIEKKLAQDKEAAKAAEKTS